jgi:hypothetical protein
MANAKRRSSLRGVFTPRTAPLSGDNQREPAQMAKTPKVNWERWLSLVLALVVAAERGRCDWFSATINAWTGCCTSQWSGAGVAGRSNLGDAAVASTEQPLS